MHCGIALRCQLSGHVVIVFDSKIVSFAFNFSAALPLHGLAGETLRGGICLGLASCLGSKEASQTLPHRQASQPGQGVA